MEGNQIVIGRFRGTTKIFTQRGFAGLSKEKYLENPHTD